MKNVKNWQRLMFLSIGLIIGAAVSLAVVIIAPPPTLIQSARDGMLINIGIQLFLVLAVYWIMYRRRKGDYKKELLVIFAVLTMLMGVIILDGFAAYYGDPDHHNVSIAMLINAICDFLAGIVLLIARYSKKSN
jgi:heme A synthase